MTFRIFFSLLICSTWGCGQTPSTADDDLYSTTDGSELFFKNIRKSEYLLTENKTAGLDIYVHKSYADSELIRAQLIHNWRLDKAYIMLSVKDTDLPIKFLINQKDTLVFDGSSMENHRVIAQAFQQSSISLPIWLIAEDTVLVVNKNTGFNETYDDFIRLTSKK
ncbi:MAG: hypothetical protein ACI9DM_001214 [Cyclobacteriaceae bacterium]|jgi:hypothetical protein